MVLTERQLLKALAEGRDPHAAESAVPLVEEEAESKGAKTKRGRKGAAPKPVTNDYHAGNDADSDMDAETRAPDVTKKRRGKAAAATTAKKGKAKAATVSKKTKKKQEEEDDDEHDDGGMDMEEIEVLPAPKKRGRAGKAAASSISSQDENEEETPGDIAKRQLKKKARGSSANVAASRLNVVLTSPQIPEVKSQGANEMRSHGADGNGYGGGGGAFHLAPQPSPGELSLL